MPRLDNRWRKSSFSGSNGGNCVEVADHDGAVLIRDTKDREHGHLAVDAATWRRFTDEIKHSSPALLAIARQSAPPS